MTAIAPTKAPTQAATTVVNEMPSDEPEDDEAVAEAEVEVEEGPAVTMEGVLSTKGVEVMTGMLDPSKPTDTPLVSVLAAVFMESAVPPVAAVAVIAVLEIPAIVGAELMSGVIRLCR